MTPTAVIYTVAVGLLTGFFFWLLSPTLDRIRDKWRERAANATLTPDTEAAMLKQLRMQQASLKRLEQFRANQTDRLLYVIDLLGAALLLFVTAVYLYALYAFRVVETLVCILPAAGSIVFFLFAIVEAHNMTDSKIDESLASLKKTIEDARAKLKVPD